MIGKLRKMRAFMLMLWIITIICVPVRASQEPEFRLDMDSLNLRIGASTNIIVSLINAQGAQLSRLDGLESFDIVSQSTMSSTSIVNMDVTYKEDLSYTVIPRTAGQYTIKAIVQYNGQYYETNSLQVNVGDGSGGESEAVSDLFVKTVLSHSEAYFGEKVVLTYELYSRYNIENYGFTDYIAIDGMVTKDMPEDSLMAEYVYLDGNKYAKYEVKQLIIDPIKSGTHVIPPFTLQVNIITNNSAGGGFSFFFNSTEARYLQTEAKELTVKPLPSEGRPNDFSGIVGELQIDSSYSRHELNYGDSLTLQATAYGNCNLDGLKSIISGEIPGFTVYETQKNSTETVDNNRYNARKEFDVILVPEQTGALDLAPQSISYFNPVTEAYERAEISGVTINVLGDMPQLTGGLANGSAIIETVVIDQVNYANMTTGNEYISLQISKDILYVILISLAVIIVIALAVILFVSKKKKRNPVLKSIYKRIMSAKDINEIYNLFNVLIKHRYDVSVKASSQNAVKNSLPDPDLAERVKDIMDYMESAKAEDAKASNHLKDRIKSVYRMMLPI